MNMHEHQTPQKIIEDAVEALYLKASGATIDRVRRQLRTTLNMDFPSVAHGHMIVSVLTENYDLIFGVPMRGIEHTRAAHMAEFIAKISDGDLVKEVMKLGDIASMERVLLGEGTGQEPPKEIESSDTMDAIAHGLYELMHRKGVTEKEGHIPVAICCSYATLQKDYKVILLVLWRRL